MADACRASGGKARGVATVRRDVTDRELEDLHDAGVRGVRFNFVKRLVDFTPQDELVEIAQRIQPLGWHVVVYFEARDLPRALGLLHRAADDRRRRSHGPARRHEAGRRPRVRVVPRTHARAREHLEQGQLPRAPVGQRPPALDGERNAVPRRRAVRAPRGRDLPRPRALGHGLAASEPEGPHARRRAAGRLHPAHRAHARAATEAAGRRTRCASTGRRRM